MSIEKTNPMKKEQKDESSVASNHAQKAVSILSKDENLSFEDRVGSVTYAVLSDVLGQKIVESVEAYLNGRGLSLYNICNQPEEVAEELTVLFGEGADFIVNYILRSTFDAIGVDNEESYTRFDLSYGLERLRLLFDVEINLPGGRK